MKIPTLLFLLFILFSCSTKPGFHDQKIQAITDKKNWTIFRGDAGLDGCAKTTIPEKLELIWRFKTGDKITSSPIVDGNMVYIGSQDKSLYGLDLSTGKEGWKTALNDNIEAPAFIDNGVIFITSLQGTVYAFSEKDKSLLWKKQLPGKVLASANGFNLSRGLPGLLVSCYDNDLYCLDRRNGNMVWTYETKNFINGTPAVTSDIDGKKRIVFGGCDSFIHVISALTGRRYSTFSLGSYIAGSAATRGQLVFIGNYKGTFACYDFVNDRLVWKYGDEVNGDPFFSSAAVNSNTVIVGSRDKNVHAIDLATGKRRWIFRTGKDVDSSPVICGEKVVACSEDGFIYIIDINTGKEINSLQIGSKITGSPAVVDGKIIIGAMDGVVYCIGEKRP